MTPLHALDHIRKSFNGSTDRGARASIGQFLTPAAIAQFMASMFEGGPQHVSLLDPGAGAGVLFAMCVEALISQKKQPLSITVDAYETDAAIGFDRRHPFQSVLPAFQGVLPI